jgi:hypothetical protein
LSRSTKRVIISIGLVLFVLLLIFRVSNPVPIPDASTVPVTTVTYQYINPTPAITQKIISVETFTVTSVVKSTEIVNYKTNPNYRTFYYVSDGSKYSLSTTLYGGLSDYFSKEDHSYHYDMDQETIMELLENPVQDENIKPLIEQIKNHPVNEQPRIAISLVQHIPYNWEKYNNPSNVDWYYPYETLYNNKGVCADKSLLLAYLLNELGYDTVLFEFSNHMAVGIKTTSNRYSFYNTEYAFIESTQPVIITYIPPTYVGGFQITPNPHIIHLKGGTKSLDVGEEYRDAIRMKQLDSMGNVLDQNSYNEWSILTTKYDLQYST